MQQKGWEITSTGCRTWIHSMINYNTFCKFQTNLEWMIKFHQPGFPANDWDFKISAKRLKPASLVVTKNGGNSPKNYWTQEWRFRRWHNVVVHTLLSNFGVNFRLLSYLFQWIVLCIMHSPVKNEHPDSHEPLPSTFNFYCVKIFQNKWIMYIDYGIYRVIQ